MFTRFTDIINALKSLGKSDSNSELVRKILRSLPRSGEAKVTAIQEAKDLTRLPLEELLGSLMTHELTMKNGEEEDDTRRTGALKASTKDESDDEEEESEDDEEFAMITRKFKRFVPSQEERFLQKASKRGSTKGEPRQEERRKHML